MVRGSCLCGAVSWEMQGPYERMSHCHCSMCRKIHAAPFATYVTLKKTQFNWLSGADNITHYQSSPSFIRSSCKNCGTVVSVGLLDAARSEEVVVSAGCLDDDPGIRPSVHIFAAAKAPWFEITGDLPRHDYYPATSTAPVIDQPTTQPREDGRLQGSCLCGGAVYLVTPPFSVVHNCHCSRCRKARAAAFTTNGFVAADKFEYTQGAELLRRYKVPDADRFSQSFCTICGSGMPNAGLTEGAVGIPFGTLDDDPGCRGQDHIFTAYMAPWDEITDGLPKFEEGPD